MRRVIDCPTVYDATAPTVIAPAGNWDFQTDRDIKYQNPFQSSSALPVCDHSVYIPSVSVTAAADAFSTSQKMIDSGENHVVWHYVMHMQLESDAVGIIIQPFVSQNEDADADMANYRFLPCQTTAGIAASITSMNAQGTIIRTKATVSGHEDDNNLIFGILVFNPTGGTLVVEGFASMSIHPTTEPLEMYDS